VYARITERPKVPPFIPTVPDVVVTVTDSAAARVGEDEAFRSLTSMIPVAAVDAVATPDTAASVPPPDGENTTVELAAEGVVDSAVVAEITKLTSNVLTELDAAFRFASICLTTTVYVYVPLTLVPVGVSNCNPRFWLMF